MEHGPEVWTSTLGSPRVTSGSTTRASPGNSTVDPGPRLTGYRRFALDDDVVALVEAERHRTGETVRQVVNRLLRRSVTAPRSAPPLPLPSLPGRPLVDATNISALLAALGDDRGSERGMP